MNLKHPYWHIAQYVWDKKYLKLCPFGAIK
jgi:hypothetical protein